MRKWWVETVEEEPAVDSAEALRYLADINAQSTIPIEIADGRIPPGVDMVPLDRIQERFLKEAHHRQYGRPWAMGRYMFDFLLDAGVRPEHRLLDFGCGALRLGLWMIPYLNAGNYCGVESHLASLEAAVTYEIPLHRLEDKRPRLLWNDEFAFSHFETEFDVIIDFSSSSQVKASARRDSYEALAKAVAPGGRLFTSPQPEASDDDFAEWGGLTPVGEAVVQRCELLLGHEKRFKSSAAWYEFTRL